MFRDFENQLINIHGCLPSLVTSDSAGVKAKSARPDFPGCGKTPWKKGGQDAGLTKQGEGLCLTA
jgi:hypothetical protein